MTSEIQDILSSRVQCHTDAGGRVYQSLTLRADCWAMLECRIRQLETESKCVREWLEKTAWVQDEYQAGMLRTATAGMHSADIMRAEIERLRTEISVMLTREQVREAAALTLPDFVDGDGSPEDGQWAANRAVTKLCRRLGVEL